MKSSQDLTSELLTYLSSTGVGSIGLNLFSPTLPQSPNIGTVVVPTGGPVDVASPIRNMNFQILHRNTNIATGFATAQQIYSAVHNNWNKIPDFGGRFVAKHEAGPHFRDDNNHPVFTLNFYFLTGQNF